VRYILFEGLDGSGKTTQISLLTKYLQKLNYSCVHLFEPSYGRYGAEVRRLTESNAYISGEEQARMFTLDRIEHTKNKILPFFRLSQKNSGFYILQDRGFPSAAIYQTTDHKRGTIRKVLEDQANLTVRPDVIIHLDISAEIAYQRIRDRKQNVSSLFEKLSLLKKHRKKYQIAMDELKEMGNLVNSIDATGDIEEVSRRIQNSLNVKPFGQGR
jgi:dTMP kinase